MNISVFGLGYVGIVTAGCLARAGHQVLGVDVNPAKVASLQAGNSPIIEAGVEDLIRSGQASGRLQASLDADAAVAGSDLAIVCVGTPSRANGSLTTDHIASVARQIGRALLRSQPRPPLLVVVRSTLLPGTMRSLVLPLLTAESALRPGEHFEAVFHPEFLREGSSVSDYYDPPKIVVGERVPGAGRRLLELYDGFRAPVFCTGYETAEMVKYCDNLFHALKITFANEIGQFCQAHAIPSHEVADIFCQDTKLNISPRYLRPGFAFGGSCLPKDLRAFLYAARQSDVATPMLAGVLPSNQSQIERVAREIIATGARRVGFHGLAFKPGTDDLRESPFVILAETLIGKGLELRILDPQVQAARLVGGNQAFVSQTLPHLAQLLVSSLADLASCELLVLGHPLPAGQISDFLSQGQRVFDLVGITPPPVHPLYQSVI